MSCACRRPLDLRLTGATCTHSSLHYWASPFSLSRRALQRCVFLLWRSAHLHSPRLSHSHWIGLGSILFHTTCHLVSFPLFPASHLHLLNPWSSSCPTFTPPSICLHSFLVSFSLLFLCLCSSTSLCNLLIRHAFQKGHCITCIDLWAV